LGTLGEQRRLNDSLSDPGQNLVVADTEKDQIDTTPSSAKTGADQNASAEAVAVGKETGVVMMDFVWSGQKELGGTEQAQPENGKALQANVSVPAALACSAVLPAETLQRTLRDGSGLQGEGNNTAFSVGVIADAAHRVPEESALREEISALKNELAAMKQQQQQQVQTHFEVPKPGPNRMDQQDNKGFGGEQQRLPKPVIHADEEVVQSSCCCLWWRR
jgi:hypothetical protein